MDLITTSQPNHDWFLLVEMEPSTISYLLSGRRVRNSFVPVAILFNLSTSANLGTKSRRFHCRRRFVRRRRPVPSFQRQRFEGLSSKRVSGNSTLHKRRKSNLSQPGSE